MEVFANRYAVLDILSVYRLLICSYYYHPEDRGICDGIGFGKNLAERTMARLKTMILPDNQEEL
jgi:hypothetical protein